MRTLFAGDVCLSAQPRCFAVSAPHCNQYYCHSSSKYLSQHCIGSRLLPFCFHCAQFGCIPMVGGLQLNLFPSSSTNGLSLPISSLDSLVGIDRFAPGISM